MRAPKPPPLWGQSDRADRTPRPGLPFGSGHVIDPPAPDWDNLGKPARWRPDWDRIAKLNLEAAEVRYYGDD
jgi:hypothetical protein